MDPVMRELFFQIIDHTLVNYYSITNYYERESNRDKLCRQLENQLTPDQRQLFDEDVEARVSEGMTEDEAREETARWTMPPGCSEHETGLAVDIVATDNQRLDDTQEQTPETIWLHENCWRFGFILRYPAGKEDVTGIDYESWHYRYVGIEAARYLTEQQLTLDEFWAS